MSGGCPKAFHFEKPFLSPTKTLEAFKSGWKLLQHIRTCQNSYQNFQLLAISKLIFSEPDETEQKFVKDLFENVQDFQSLFSSQLRTNLRLNGAHLNVVVDFA